MIWSMFGERRRRFFGVDPYRTLCEGVLPCLIQWGLAPFGTTYVIPMGVGCLKVRVDQGPEICSSR